jgi:predicted RNase H-like HicB family nuclease
MLVAYYKSKTTTDDVWCAFVPGLPGCNMQFLSKQDMFRNALDVISSFMYVADFPARQLRDSIPSYLVFVEGEYVDQELINEGKV